MLRTLKTGALRRWARAARPANRRGERMYRGRRSANFAFVSLSID
jgi:hypothetical protein